MGRKIIFAGVILFAFLGCAPKLFAGATEDMAAADNFVVAGQNAQAETKYQQITAANLGTTVGLESQRKLIILYVEQGKQEQADGALQGLVTNFSQNPYTTWEVFGLGERYREQDKKATANKFYQCIVNNWPSAECAILALFHIAVIDMATGDDAGAQAAYQKIVTDHSNNQNVPAMVYEIAEGYRAAGKNAMALPCYKYIADNCGGKDFTIFCQMYVVTLNLSLGNDEAAQIALKKLLVDFSSNEKIATALWEVSQCSHKLQKYDKLNEFYQYILDTGPQGEYTLWPLVGKAVSSIGVGNYTSAEAIAKQMASNYSQHPYLANAMSLIAEEYYLRAFKLDTDANSVVSRECVQKAVSIWQTIVNDYPGSSEAAKACFCAADCYSRLGQYQTSIVLYQKVVSNYPTDNLAENALFMLGRSYETMADKQLISKSAAGINIKAAYEQFVEKYPDSKSAAIAKRWLTHQAESK